LLLNACPSYEEQNEGSYSRLAQQFLRVSTTQLQPVYAILGKTWLTGARDLPKPPEVAAVSENPLFKPSAQRHHSFNFSLDESTSVVAWNSLLNKPPT